MRRSTTDDPLLSPEQAAALLDTTPADLAQMRNLGTGPEWALLTRKTIRYSRADLEAWRTHTTQTRGREDSAR